MQERKPPDVSHPATRGNDHPCVGHLKALASGNLTHWRGLQPDCGLPEVEAALAPALHGGSAASQISGPRDYAPTAGAPNGITIHFEEGRIAYVSILAPALGTSLVEALGAPDGKLPSGLEGSDEQWVYAGLGLACHIGYDGKKVNWLYAFPPVSLATYEQGPLSKVFTIRHRTIGRST